MRLQRTIKRCKRFLRRRPRAGDASDAAAVSRQQIYTHGACCPHTQHPIRLPAVGTRLNAVSVTSRYISPQGTFQLQSGAVKAVYIAPSKSLVQVQESCSYQHVSLPPNMSESIAASQLCAAAWSLHCRLYLFWIARRSKSQTGASGSAPRWASSARRCQVTRTPPQTPPS